MKSHIYNNSVWDIEALSNHWMRGKNSINGADTMVSNLKSEV